MTIGLKAAEGVKNWRRIIDEVNKVNALTDRVKKRKKEFFCRPPSYFREKKPSGYRIVERDRSLPPKF